MNHRNGVNNVTVDCGYRLYWYISRKGKKPVKQREESVSVMYHLGICETEFSVLAFPAIWLWSLELESSMCDIWMSRDRRARIK